MKNRLKKTKDWWKEHRLEVYVFGGIVGFMSGSVYLSWRQINAFVKYVEILEKNNESMKEAIEKGYTIFSNPDGSFWVVGGPSS